MGGVGSAESQRSLPILEEKYGALYYSVRPGGKGDNDYPALRLYLKNFQKTFPEVIENGNRLDSDEACLG